VADQPPDRITTGLHDLARALREAPPLSPDGQRALAELIDELGNAVGGKDVPPAEVTHLAQTTAQFVQALHRRQEPGVLASARDSLERAILRAESHAPVAAGVARRALDALANFGI
jgi:hypothetical protein